MWEQAGGSADFVKERQKEKMHAGTHIQTTKSMKGHSSSTLMAHGYSGPECHM